MQIKIQCPACGYNSYNVLNAEKNKDFSEYSPYGFYVFFKGTDFLEEFIKTNHLIIS